MLALYRCPLLFQQLLLQPAFQTLIVGFIIQGIHSLLLLGLLCPLQLLAAGGLQGPLLLALVQPERSPAGWLRVHVKVLLRHLRGRDVRWGLLL